MSAVALAALAVVLTAVAPPVMARQTVFRRAPRPALLGWQAVSLAAVLSAVSVAPLAVHVLVLEDGVRTDLDRSGWASWAALPALLLSGLVLGRLLWSGHLVGTRLRTARRQHRLLVDALGEAVDDEVRVLAHPTPTAYCLPGLRRRVVLTEGTLSTLPAVELDAVLAHERAHLRARHDLVIEFFTVLHQSVPARLQAPEALREVRLLVEVLADRAARRVTGPLPVARALVALAGATHPETALAASADVGATRARMALLAQDDAPRWLPPVVYAFAATVLATPVALLVLALGSMRA